MGKAAYDEIEELIVSEGEAFKIVRQLVIRQRRNFPNKIDWNFIGDFGLKSNRSNFVEIYLRCVLQ